TCCSFEVVQREDILSRFHLPHVDRPVMPCSEIAPSGAEACAAISAEIPLGLCFQVDNRNPGPSPKSAKRQPVPTRAQGELLALELVLAFPTFHLPEIRTLVEGTSGE